ncbi:hypothetical protein ACG04R_16460 [Roseateles sp. BYS78W]|uniref:Collagen-like protein n=1 Tax=Pelomonas candidula TaxID=3299025 RepID=A0ABW7HF01_9BURK
MKHWFAVSRLAAVAAVVLGAGGTLAQSTAPAAPSPAAPASASRFAHLTCLPGGKLVLNDVAMAVQELEMFDGCVLSYDPSVRTRGNKVSLTIQNVILHGKSKIDLTDPNPRAADGVGHPDPHDTPTQAVPTTNKGQRGYAGGAGTAGETALALDMDIQQWDPASDGSLWIDTDGQAGGNGGLGGKGAKGSAGPWTRVHCYDGGDGGDGGPGGAGGAGGDTSRVRLILRGAPVASQLAASKVAPSDWPPDVATNQHVIIVSGGYGKGGAGGAGGPSGDVGEGHQCKFPATDAHEGHPGSAGPRGADGSAGHFIP